MRLWKTWLLISLCSVALAVPAAASDDQGKRKGHAKQERKHKDGKRQGPKAGKPEIRFHGMDRNGDRVITRAEWRGEEQAFASRDWNGDGVLSGDEVTPGAARPTGTHGAHGTTGRLPHAVAPGGDPDAALFAGLDRNRDGVLSHAEWRGSDYDFRRLDFNHDGVLSPYEFGVGR
jgi:hypothetical protein